MMLLSRLLLAALSVLALAAVLPRYAGQAFPRDYESVIVSYSAVQDRLILSRHRGGNWTYADTQGAPLDEDAMRAALPFKNLHLLERQGRLPREVAGWPFDRDQAVRHDSRIRLSPSRLDRPGFGLYTLMESAPGVKGLETPPDMFRMTDRIEFIDAASNRIDEAKSRRFSEALAAEGFAHPARLVGDSPSTMKAYDNGVLLVDAQGRVFHLWLLRGEPKVVRTETLLPPSALNIQVMEQARREYHGLVTLPDGLLLLDWRNHAPRRIPLEGYDPARENFSADGNPLHWEFSRQRQGGASRYFVLTDPQLNPVLDYTWREGEDDARKRAIRENGLGFLFPWRLDFDVRERSQRGLYFQTFDAAWWVTLAGIASALCAYALWRRRRSGRLPHGLDLLFVALTGWPGALALAALGPLQPRRARRD